MSAFQIQTISDRDAAERLGFPLRTVRKVVDEHGLCLRAGRVTGLCPRDSWPRLGVLWEGDIQRGRQKAPKAPETGLSAAVAQW